MKLELNGVVLQRADTTTVCGDEPLNFTIDSGEAVVVEAPHEWGKTLLARAVLGLWPVGKGCISYDCEPITPASSAWMRRYVGYVPQRRPDDAPPLEKQIDELVRGDRKIIVVDDAADEELLDDSVKALQQAGKTVLWLRYATEFNIMRI